MIRITLQELACLDAVATEGNFLAAAAKLHRTHPSVHSAIKSLEQQLGVCLLDRSQYRVALTAEGRAIHARARSVLAEARALESLAHQMAQGDESDLHVAIGALCPSSRVTGLLGRFFARQPNTRLHLHHETVSGPGERLCEGQADLVFHAIDKSDLRFEFIDLFEVQLLPVAAPGFLDAALATELSPLDMKAHVQCVLRDSARRPSAHEHYLIDGGRHWTVADQSMKKEVIQARMAWGYLPEFMVREELRDGSLLSLEGRHYKRISMEVVAARLRKRDHGPVANRLWHFLQDASAHGG
jgi:DNA-binding transcriptional LysR family regulator